MAYYKDFIYLYIRSRNFMYVEPKKNIYGTLEVSRISGKTFQV